MAYYASTDPKTVAGVAGVSAEYTNFNAINTPTLNTTGSMTVSGTMNATGTNNMTGVNKILFSSTNSIGGTSQSTEVSANISAQGVQYLIPSGSSTPFYLLDSPSAGQQVTLYCLSGNTSHPTYVYTDNTSSLSVHVKNVGSGVHTSSNCLITMNRGQMLSLLGFSTAAWLITHNATQGSTGLATFSSST